MRATPVVVGSLVLAFGLLVLLSVLRPMRTHVFQDARGDSFSIEIHKDWSPSGLPHAFRQVLEGPLPSGARGRIALSSLWDLGPEKAPPPDELQENWEAEGARYTLRWVPGVPMKWCRLRQGTIEFNAMVFGIEPITPEDDDFYDRCLRSIRRVRK